MCAALNESDYIFGNHRSHGHYIAKGGSLREMIAEIYGKSTGCSGGRGGSMHLIARDKGMLGSAPIVAGTISLATGAALASRIRRDGRVTVSFFGDGSTGEGVLYEAMNFAAVQKLSIVFVCENNLYSTHMPISACRPRNDIFRIAKPFQIESHRVDGNDVLKVYEMARKAVETCRSGQGPVFLECLTYRLRGHVGPDDNVQGMHTDIRPDEEIRGWRKKDPIDRFERYLERKKVLKNTDKLSIREMAESEVREAYLFAQESPHPKPHELTDHVFQS
jgi:pyruvate dehydrogenase E1 component alpha subunit